MLKFSFLGKTKVEYQGKDITELFGNKTIALICMLVLNDKKAISREKIIAYLWPDSNEDAAKYNLRFNLWLIKKNIGTDNAGNSFLCVDKECCEINEKYKYTCDLLEITRFKPRDTDSIADLLRLKELFTGEFLEGCYFNNCEELNELILFERINLEKKKVSILKRIAELYETEKQYESCLEKVLEIQEIEPYDEEIALKIMDLYAIKGNNAKAIDYYNIFSNTLATSLGIAPGDLLKKKCEELKTSNEESEEENKNTLKYNHIEIEIYGINCSKFFGIAQIIDQIVEKVDEKYFEDFKDSYTCDLWHIQRKIVSDIKKYKEEFLLSVPLDTNIINSFIELIRFISTRYFISIKVNDYKDLDKISKDVLEYLKKLKIKGVIIK